MCKCYDCGDLAEKDEMHLIKASNLSGRALICGPCHAAEVARIRQFNVSRLGGVS